MIHLKQKLSRIGVLFLSFLFACSLTYGSVHFDDNDDVIDLGDACTNWSSVSVSAWIRLDDDPGAGEFPIIFDCNDNVNSVFGGFDWFVDENEIVNFRVRASDNTQEGEVSSSTVSSGTWVHLGVTYSDSANEVKFYINGSLDVTRTNSKTLGESDANGAIGDLNTAGFTFDGKIQDLAIWSAVLTANEMLQLSSSRIKGLPYQIQGGSLVRYWPLDDCADGTSGNGVTFQDMVGGINGTGDHGADASGLDCVGTEHLSFP